MLYRWQIEAANQIKEKDALISAPTGAGKTKVAYIWAGIMDQNEKIVYSGKEKVIFTAPIKALSNERYMELKKLGLNVGLETGDFKKNTNANIICCTQEIYTMKYAHLPDQKVIVDEFHCITTDPKRARAYIDGIVGTHKSSRLLVMSATFGEPEEVTRYLNNITGRNFEMYTTNERVTELKFLNKPVNMAKIKNALVFVFSRRGVEDIAEEIADLRREKGINRPGPEKTKKLKTLAKVFSIDDIDWTLYEGVGKYHGSMYPKEKLFIETAYREGLIDVVVGTDALSLGVNLPAETVVFAQLAKYYDGPISKNEFLQMAGRAGRKGYFDVGYVTYYPSLYESFEYDTGELYNWLLQAPVEPMRIQIDISVPALLKGRSIEEEAEYVSRFSLPRQSNNKIKRQIIEIMETIELFEEENKLPKKEFRDVLRDIYFPEYDLMTNLYLARRFMKPKDIKIQSLVDIIFPREPIKSEFYGYLQLKKWLNSIPESYSSKVIDRSELDRIIDSLDPTITKFEEALEHADRTLKMFEPAKSIQTDTDIDTLHL